MRQVISNTSPQQHNVSPPNNTVWTPPQGYGAPPQWASAQWGSPNGPGFPPGMGYPMGGMTSMGGMGPMGPMGMMGPMGYPMSPWGYGMGERQPYPSPPSPNVRSSPDFGMYRHFRRPHRLIVLLAGSTPTSSSFSYSPTCKSLVSNS
jgi:hypothetical protein